MSCHEVRGVSRVFFDGTYYPFQRSKHAGTSADLASSNLEATWDHRNGVTTIVSTGDIALI